MIIEVDFLDHPKTLKLVRLLGAEAPMLLIRLWAFCQNRKTDELPSDPEDIAAVCRYQGETETLVAALERCGWLEPLEAGGWLAHGWLERNAGWLARCKGGSERAKKAARNGNGTMSKGASASMQPADAPASSQLAGSRNGEDGSAAGVYAGADELSLAKLPPIVPQGGQFEGGAGASKTHPPSPADSPEKKEGGRAADVLEDTKRRICDIFGRRSLFLGDDAERALAESLRRGELPLPAADWELLEWWYAQPKDERDSDLKARRQHAESLAKNLLSEIDRARGYAKKTGRSAEQKKNGGALELAQFQAWHAVRFPEMAVPQSFDGVPDYVLAEAKAALIST